jgi:hypothetical protein
LIYSVKTNLQSLKVVSRAPVPQVNGAIVSAADEHSVTVGSHALNDGIVSVQVLDEFSLRASPLLDVVWTCRCKHIPSKTISR